MTVEINIVTLLILVVVILVATFLLSMIWQPQKPGHKTDALLEGLSRELLTTIRNCIEISERINRTSVTIEQGERAGKKTSRNTGENHRFSPENRAFPSPEYFYYERECSLSHLGVQGNQQDVF